MANLLNGVKKCVTIYAQVFRAKLKKHILSAFLYGSCGRIEHIELCNMWINTDDGCKRIKLRSCLLLLLYKKLG